MAKIARRSVASNPSSLTTTTTITNTTTTASTTTSISRTLPNSNQQQSPSTDSSVTQSILIGSNKSSILLTDPIVIVHNNQQNDNSTNSSSTSSANNSDYTNHTNNYINTKNITTTSSTTKPGALPISITTTKSSPIITSSSTATPLPSLHSNSSSTSTGNYKTETKHDHLFNATAKIDLIAAERERMRIEFYATYDVMTGVRIAATLGGFFGLMVFLIVYKSRSHSNETLKVLKDPKTAALAVACMQEEEDRKIMEAMDATGLSIFPDEYDTMLFRRQRMLSLGNVSAPPVLNRGFRFSSVGGGGYSSLLEPPRRSSFSYGGPGSRRKSTSESSRILSNYPMGSSFGTDDYFVETDDELDNDYNQLNERDETILQNQGFLEVPRTSQDRRRSSAMTCCSTESSYLERRCSALTLGINQLPPSLRQKLENANGQQRSRNGSSTELWDYYYPDIQVIQATPKTSPCPSERSLYDKPKYTTTRTGSQDTTTTAGSGISSIAVDSGGSSTYNYHKNSTSCYYDPESLQDKRLKSICDSENGGSFYHHFDMPIENGGSNRQNNTSKYEDNNELKLMVMKRKFSDASSCTTSNNNINNNNNNTLSYILNNNNSSFTEAQAAAIAVIDGAVVAHMQRAGGICGTGVGRAPLASCSSFKMSSIEYQDSDLKSVGEDDSIFVESYADTDDDLEQFSTDSDEISLDIDEDDRPLAAASASATTPISVATHRKFHDKDNQILEPPPLPIIGGSSSTTLTPNNQQKISIKSEPICTDLMTDIKKGVIAVPQMNKSRRRPSLERHRTLSVSSSDKVQLVSKNQKRSGRVKTSILETHFSSPSTPIIQHEELLLKPKLSPSNTPILALRRAQLQQQSSDPQSLPTTTDEATTTTLETCCSTEVPVVITTSDQLATNNSRTIPISGGVTRKQLLQSPFASSSTTTIPTTMKKTSSFSYDNNNDSSLSSSSNSNNKSHKTKHFRNNSSSSKLKNYRSHFSDGGCCDQLIESSHNDGILVQESLDVENLISHSSKNSNYKIKPEQQQQFVVNDKSLKNNHKLKLNRSFKKKPQNRFSMAGSGTPKGPFVILELPIINLPPPTTTTAATTTSTAAATTSSDCYDDHDYSEERDDRSRGTCSEGAIRRHNQPFRDPSLPGSSRKWSKETLF